MEVLERFALGDLDAFEALFRQFQGQVYGWIIRIVLDRGVAEDLTVETFWRIYRAHARFNPEADFGGLGPEDCDECSARPFEDSPARSCVARKSCGASTA